VNKKKITIEYSRENWFKNYFIYYDSLKIVIPLEESQDKFFYYCVSLSGRISETSEEFHHIIRAHRDINLE